MKALRPLIIKLSKEHNIPESIVKEIYDNQFKFMRKTIEEIDFRTMTEEEFNELKQVFIITFLGKFYTNWKRIKYINENNEQKSEL